MTKKIIFPVLFILIVGLIFIYFSTDNSKFYLDSKYYLSSEFVSVDKIDDLSKANYVMYIYGDFCAFSTPCEDIFKSFMDEYNISFIKMHYDNFKNTKYYKDIYYPPSVLVIRKGKIVAYLDAEKDEDIVRYQDVLEFKKWINNYIYLEKNS